MCGGASLAQGARDRLAQKDREGGSVQLKHDGARQGIHCIQEDGRTASVGTSPSAPW